MLQLSPQQTQQLSQAPVGHLATASQAGAPHVVPVCFVLDPERDSPSIYIVLDRKPKRAALTRLRRVRNILENPQVALIVDHYAADWGQLWYILLTGISELLEAVASPEAEISGASVSPAHPGLVEGRQVHDERRHAIHLLRRKYSQYRDMDLDDNPVIKITPQKIISWSSSP